MADQVRNGTSGSVGQRPLPLRGLRVVSSANALPAAIVGQVLADYGADVVLLEPPAGSRLRAHRAWGHWTRGQRSVRLDLRVPDDQERARRLLDRSDVFIDGWGPGVAERLGLGPDLLEARNPRLVQVRISAFGDDTPLAHLKGWESVVMALIGGNTTFANLSGGARPAFVSTPYCSVAAAHLALHGALGALVERERSGRGQRVRTSLLQGFLAFDTWNWLIRLLALRHPSSFELQPPFDPETLVPNSPLSFRLLVALAKDGTWLQFSQTTDRLWAAFLRACGLDAEDPRVKEAPVAEDPAVRVAFWETLLAAVRQRTAQEWQAVFDADPDVWAEQFRDERTALGHPQLVDDHRVSEGPDGLLIPGALVQGAAWPPFVTRPGPAFAEVPEGLWDSAMAAAAAGHAGDEPALDGVTILELGTFYAGPYGTTLLAEQGARVIKVESGAGDPIRHVAGFPELGGIKVLHGKESVVADLATPEGQALLAQLVRAADVVLLSYRAGVAERLHCTPAELLAINPELVYVSSPGYGDGPPCGHRPAFAPTIGAASGLAVRNIGGSAAVAQGPDLDEMTVKRTALRLSSAAMGMGNADGFAALGAGTAILLGLLGQRRFGGGNVVRASMLSTVSHALADWTVTGPGAATPAPDEELLGVGPLHRLYETAQGWVLLAVTGEAERDALSGATGINLNEAGCAERLAALFRTDEALSWQECLTAKGVTCVAVAPEGVEQTMMLGSLGTELGVVTTARHPVMEEYPRPAALTTYSRSRSVLAPAPLLGQDTEAITAEFAVATRTGRPADGPGATASGGTGLAVEVHFDPAGEGIALPVFRPRTKEK